MVVCCLFVLVVATLSDFGLLFKKIEALIELRKKIIRCTVRRFGNCSTSRYPDSADLLDLLKMQLT